jgi:hypothetical protein
MPVLPSQLPVQCAVCKRPTPTYAFCSAACEASVKESVAQFWRSGTAMFIEARAVREYWRAKEGESFFH